MACAALRTLVAAVSATLALAACPHEDAALNSWSSASSWDSGAVPAASEAVVISQPILLDVATPDLTSVRITDAGKLVFDPSVELAKLAAEWVLVNGELWVGSEDCPFSGRAEIELIGKKGESAGVDVGGAPHVKALLVDTGRLEIHGEPRTPWTRLTTTLPKTTRELVVGLPIFDYTTTEYKKDWYRGFIGFELAADGQPMRFLGRLRRSCQFAELIASQDSVVLLVVQRRVELDAGQEFDRVAEAFEQVCYGGDGRRTHLRSLSQGETVAWAAICHIGHPENSVEELGHPDGDESVTSRLVQRVGGTDFLVQSVTQLDRDWPYRVDMLSYSAGTVPASTVVLDTDRELRGWSAGDAVVVASTDYDWRQAEELTLLECAGCAPGQIELGRPIHWTHWGETTDGVNMGAEVGALNRNVRIHGRMEDACYGDNNCDSYNFDTFGGHIKMFAGFQTARISNAELFHMGQNSVIGSYPIHFHMCGDVDSREDPPYVKSNAIHHTFARCITIHGTSGLLVEDNMAFYHLGHCYFLEDGGEKRTVLRGNLGLSTVDTDITPSDHQASTFWITNPATTLEGNVAGGSDSFGIWYTFPRQPIGPSAELGLMEENEAFRTPLGPFVDNVAHSNNEYGLLFDRVLQPNGHTHGGFNYNPRENPLDENSPAVSVTFDGYTGFKNYKSVWMRAPQVTAQRFKIAESVEGITFAYSYPGVKRLKDSLLVGETANKGRPEGNIQLENGTVIYWDRQIRMGGADRALPIIGAIFYNGIVQLEDVTFNRFATNVVRPSGGIGMRRRTRDYTSPVNSVSGATFLYSDPAEGNRVYDASEGRGFEDRAGNIQSVIRDVDGSVTTYPGSSIVKPYDIHLNARCAEVPQWNLYVCPAKFTKLAFLWWDSAANPLRTFLTRSDRSASFGQENYQVSYALNTDEVYILHFNTTVPRHFKLRLGGIEAGITQTVGVCIGIDVTPVVEFNAIPVSSLSDLDENNADVMYYHDPTVGIVFFRFRNNNERTPETVDECPGMEGEPAGCPTVQVVLPSINTDGDCSERAYPTYSTTPLDAAGGLTTPDFTV